MTQDIKPEISFNPNAVYGTPQEADGWSAQLRLFLDEDGTASLRVTDHHNSDTSVPFSIWHGRDRLWIKEAPVGVVSEPAIQELAEAVAPLLTRIHAGREVVWDGSNMVGRYTDDAHEAVEAVERLVEECEFLDESVSVWDAGDWVAGDLDNVMLELGIEPQMSDEAKAAAAQALHEKARADDVRLDNVEDAIERMIEATTLIDDMLREDDA